MRFHRRAGDLKPEEAKVEPDGFSITIPIWLLEATLVVGLVVGLVSVMSRELNERNLKKAQLIQPKPSPGKVLVSKRSIKKSRKRTVAIASVAAVPVEAPSDDFDVGEPSVAIIGDSKLPSFAEIEERIRLHDARRGNVVK